MRRGAIVVVVAVAVGASWAIPSGGGAQDGTPTVVRRAADYLPAAADLGEGWTMKRSATPEADGDVFAGSASAVYVGTEGARLYVGAWIARPGRVALQRSWSEVGAVYEGYRTHMLDGYVGEDLPNAALPDGCVDLRHAEGDDAIWGLPMGLTVCAVEPDAVVLTAANGEFAGLTGADASDALADLCARTAAHR